MTKIENSKAPDNSYEKRDVNAGKIMLFVALFAVFLAVTIVLLNDYFTAATEEQIYDAVLRPESAALRELRAREDEMLNSYKILDSTKGTYQIPIERAMKLMADEAFQTSEKVAK